MRQVGRICGIAAMWMGAGVAVAQTQPAAPKLDAVEQMLIDRPLASAVTELSKDAGDDRRRFALGIAQAFKAVENLQAGVALLGVREDGLGKHMPFLRLSHAAAATPLNQPGPAIGPVEAMNVAGDKIAAAIAVPVTAKIIDDGLARFRDDLAVALKTLEPIKDPDVALTLPVLRTQFDLNGPLPGGAASLGDVLARLGVLGGEQPQNVADFTLHLDYGDVCWLRGYLHLLTAATDLMLAYDKAELIDTCGELFFERVAHSPGYPPNMRPVFDISDGIDIVDVIAFVHQLRLPVKDATAFAAARAQLLATINESRASWAAILKETDNDHEWIPNPQQQSVLPRMRVTPEIVQNWYRLLDDGQAVLDGTKLVPFWRADDGRGINIRMLAEKPPAFDPVMWVQGAPLGPYLQKGPLADAQSFRQLERLLEGNFFYFAALVN